MIAKPKGQGGMGIINTKLMNGCLFVGEMDLEDSFGIREHVVRNFAGQVYEKLQFL